ncbi:VOC family protein [Flavobacterium sp. HSC-61S13]|uniref:VOC family protein n=1 Tax=Flavobacterium sp. HSC-61S13 TaxID=2910963 RepID=UPI00209E619E|nr:VOC family protein [Flavobacterium sp. HSC-61S13]MCP1996154.1 catechol 2,3-dioxygenase-like lactoylglutathione lyase family enzyme [Flavobacterium sp. HSC-61S13]
MKISHLDHLVLTVVNIDKTCEFYSEVLGMEIVTFEKNKKALQFGNQKIYLHLFKHETFPKARNSTPGSADLCLITTTPLEAVLKELTEQKIPVLEGGISERLGATGKIRSVFFRDPDLNLIAVSNYI